MPRERRAKDITAGLVRVGLVGIVVYACSADTDDPLVVQTGALSAAQTVSFQDGTNGYVGTVDTRISQNSSTTNYGTSTTLSVSGDSPTGSGRDVSALIRWDLSSIPVGSTIESVAITLRIANTSSNTYSVFALKRSWSESTATWQRAATGANWQSAGAKGTNDRDSTVLGSITASALGSYTATLNSAGVAKVKQWVDDPAQNFGFIVASTSNRNMLGAASSETSTLANRPRLSATYLPPQPPDAGAPGSDAAAEAGGSDTDADAGDDLGPAGGSGGGGADTGGAGGSGGQAPLPAVLYALGDTGDCNVASDSASGLLLDGSTDPIAMLGDMAYPNGSATNFANCFVPPWGRHKARMRPVPGNHEYVTAGAAGYFGYFGAAAGDPSKGYYSYELGGWHIVALNSNCSNVSCSAGSAQEQWLRQDLAAHPSGCTLAYWHHSRFSSGIHGNATNMTAIWQALMDASADVVLTAHNHGYERWVAQDASGNAVPNGIVQFVVGTGGGSDQSQSATKPANTVIRDAATRGVLNLTLGATGYDWQYIPIAGQSFTDQGSGSCH